MKRLRAVIFGVLSLVLIATPLLIGANPVGANSYFGGNGRLVFYSPSGPVDNTAQEIYTVKPDGTDLKQITTNGLSDANPQWAPSGTKIAFDRFVSGAQGQDIYIQNINSDGSVNGSATVLSGANTPVREFDPSWSPDGTKIAYHRCPIDTADADDDDDVDECLPTNGHYQIYVIPATGGSSPTRITNDGSVEDTEPTWRKDGAYLAYKHGNGVQIATADGSSTDEVDTVGGSPQWSPVANKVVYSKNGELWVYDQDTDQASQLTHGAPGASAPTWSPDGKLIATSNSGTIYYYNATTGSLVASKSVASSGDFVTSNNANEVDWARAAAPENTTHECTTYVNEDCTDFTPEIPAECQDISTAATHGTPKYENDSFSFSPTENYVGNDTYVYQYYDENMNAITCTVNITVLPRAPESGTGYGLKPLVLYGALGAAIIGGAVILRKKAHR